MPALLEVLDRSGRVNAVVVEAELKEHLVAREETWGSAAEREEKSSEGRERAALGSTILSLSNFVKDKLDLRIE